MYQSKDPHGFFLLASLLLSSLAATCRCNPTFSSLQNTLLVSASPKPGQLLKAGEDEIEVKWSLNQTFPAGTDSGYKAVKLKLCYAPISQVDRGWRKTEDNLSRDKTCQHSIVTKPYSTAAPDDHDNNGTYYSWRIQRDVPTATYFVRGYVLDSAGSVVAFGQTTDARKAANLFRIQGVSGRDVSLDICSVCFSAFSVVSLFAFFFVDKRRSKSGQPK